MIQLCAIPTCRIRGRHLPACDGEQCGGCLPRTTDDGLVCDVCVGSAGGRLAEIIQLAPDARLVAAGLVRRGTGGGGGKPASRPPIDVAATDVLDEVTNALTTIARDIAETRGLHFVSTALDDRYPPDPLNEAAKWISGQMSWLKHAVDDQGGPYAATVFAEIADCASRMRSIVDGPSAKKYLGPCGAVRHCDGLEPDDWPEGDCGNHTPHGAHDCEPCEGDVYGRPNAATGRCRSCGAEVDQGERQAWLDEQVADSDLAWTAKGIADALSISAKTIRSWATEIQINGRIIRAAKLRTYYRRGEHVVPWTAPAEGEDVKARGPRLYYVGDVRELAREADERREVREHRQQLSNAG